MADSTGALMRRREAGRGLRRAALFSCFAGAAGLVIAGSVGWLRDARLGRPGLVFDYPRMMAQRLPELARDGSAGAYTVGVLGDSALVSYPPGLTVPDRLQQAVDALAPDRAQIRVHSLGMRGTGAFDYYFLADEIAAAGPDLIVLSLNLEHFSRPWQSAYSRPQLAGWIRPGRLFDALVRPLHWTGLTTDRLLLYTAVVQGGAYDPWYWLTVRQAQVGRARDRLELWLAGSPTELPAQTNKPEALKGAEEQLEDAVNRATIARLFTSPDLYRYRREGLVGHYADTLAGVDPDHPVLEAVAATVRALRDADVATLVYLVPVDVAYMAELGVLDRAGLDRTIDASRSAVVENGGGFVDLHDLFPTELFRDGPGHLSYPSDAAGAGEGSQVDGPAELAAALAPLVMERAHARGGSS